MSEVWGLHWHILFWVEPGSTLDNGVLAELPHSSDTLNVQAQYRGGGTGPADPAAAGPIIHSEISRTKNYHKNIFYLM